ncbi:hypothetical protein F5Y04DRAFT_272113 [Hypomontagnella monticulosa]|nr:hypothetical protein F5Y04DRAFT_272113 [Hypomontagnella monticulosa]
MGRPPAYIFIVRHGKRLDASDKQWHLSSPTPYDPPLTYGGWMQSKTVGSRIASILHEREEEDAAAAASHEPDTTHIKQKKRRYKVVIHSSPFLRCVQSSVAIAAGLASNPPLPAPTERSPSPRSNQVSPLASAARPRPTVSTQTNSSHDSSSQHTFEKSVLRLDAFLGEWLSPDYFEHITPPPRSSLMLANAKAELLRRENYNDYPHFHTRHSPSVSGQLWSASSNRGSPLAASVTPESDAPGLDSLSSLRGGLPRVRSDSAGNLEPRVTHKVYPPDPAWNTGYVSPVPSYALSTSEPIPRGYVAHARDACVDVDYQWDSSREHLSWGDGGVLPEEWAAMHQRFRKGFRRLVEWYSTTENPGEMVTKLASSPTSARSLQNDSNHGALSVGEDEDTEIENVVVLVSHGAGCNALIGAITQQPVLIDVGMSSITMAERKPEFDGGIDTSVFERPASSLDEPLITKPTTMSEIFELRLFANTEHLSTITPPSISRSSSSAGRHTNGFSSALKDINFGASLYGGPASGSRSNSVNASLGSMRRGSPVMTTIRQSLPNNAITGGVTVGSNVTSFSSTRQNRSGSTGLWAPPQVDGAADKPAEKPPLTILNQETDIPKENGRSLLRTREQDASSNGRIAPDLTKAAPPKSGSQSSHGEEHDKFDEHALPRLWSNAGNGGLWGTPRPPGEAERNRDFSSTKRRWTVNER